jgi:hypothetical protein
MRKNTLMNSKAGSMAPMRINKALHTDRRTTLDHEYQRCVLETTSLALASLLRFEHIAIQCPDTPSADSLAAAWGLFRFFQASGKKARLF